MTDENRSKEDLLRELKQLRNQVAKLEAGSLPQLGAISESDWKRLVQAAPVGVYVTLDSDFVYTNPMMTKLTGYSSDELKSMNPMDLVHPEMRELAKKRGQAHARGEAVEQRYVVHCQNKAGDSVWIDFFAEDIELGGQPAILGTAIDITDRTEAQAALSKSEERYRHLVDNLPVGIFQATPAGKILSVNRILPQLYGFDSIEALLAARPEDTYADPKDREAMLQRLRRDGSFRDLELKMRRVDGSHFWVSVSTRAVHDEHGNIIRFEGIETDITERKLATDALKQSGATMSALLNAPTQSLFLIDTQGILLTLNEAFAEKLNRSIEELIGTCVHDYIPAPLLESRKAKELEVIESGQPVMYVDEHEGYWREVRLYPVADDRGRVEAIAVYALDITERKKAEAKLAESEERFRGILSSLHETMIVMYDRDGTYLEAWIGADLEERYGMTGRSLIGKSVRDMLPSEMVPPVLETIQRIFATGKSEREEYCLPLPTGEFWHDISISPVKDDSGEITALVGFIRDITQQKQAEKEREKFLHDMHERVKELQCMYRVAESIQTRTTLEEIFQDAANAIPSGWHYPEISRGRVIFDGKEYVSEPFEETRWKLSSDIIINGKYRGSIDVFYLDECPELDEDPFLSEERDLIDGIARNISEAIERRQAAESLRKSEQFNRAVIESSPLGISVRNRYGKLLSVNQAWRDIWEIPEETIREYMAADPSDLNLDYKDDYLGEWQSKVVKVYREGGLLHIPEIRVDDHRSGEPRWVSHRFYAIPDESGQVDRVVILTNDITDRKLAEETLRTSQANLLSILESTDDFILLSDQEGKAIFYNTAYSTTMQRLFGIEMEPGLAPYTLLPDPAQRQTWAGLLSRALSGEQFTVKHSTEDQDGVVRYFESVYNPVIDGTEIVGFSEFTRDITERKLTEEALRESEELFRVLADTAPIGIVINQGNEVVYANEFLSKIAGAKFSESEDLDIWQFVHPDDRQMVQERALARQRGEEVPSEYEVRIVHPDGSTRTCLLMGKQIEYRGTPASLGISVDITERKLTEEALRESEERLRSTIESLNELVFLLDANGVFEHYYQPATKLDLFASPEQFLGKSIEEILPPDVSTKIMAALNSLKISGAPQHVDYSLIIDGELRWYSAVVSRRMDAAGGFVGITGVIREITDRKKSEEALRSSQANLLSILENTDDLIMLADRNSRIVYMNSAFTKSVKDLIGIDIEPGINLNEKMPEGSGQEWQGLYDRALSGERFLYEFSWQAVSGETRYYETRFSPILSDDQVQGFSQNTHDVTERKLAEVVLKESEDKFRTIAERSFDVILVTDNEGNLNFVSPASKAVLGYDPADMVGRNITEFVNHRSLPDVAHGFAENALGRSIEGIQVEMTRADGEIVYAEVNATPVIKADRVVGSQAIVRDISMRRHAEEMLEQAYDEQSRQLRQVAGGLAHDVYNDLFPVAAAIHKLRQRLIDSNQPVEERDRRLLDLMDRAVRRAVDLTESVNLYSKLDKEEIAAGANLASIIGDVQDQNKARVSELGISVEIQLPNTIDIACSRIQIFYLFNNLFLNAIDALKDSATRFIRISASQDSKQVRIEFEDSGQGIPPEVLPRIFDPFFSTRPKTGTGLGLAIVRRIIDLSGGEIDVKSSLDKGTTFTIILPGNVGT